VIRLLTLCFSLACLLAFVWFGVTVDLGERTLFGHLRAIGTSREAKDLWEGTKSKVTDFIGIEAAKRAAAAKAREAAERLHAEPGSGRLRVEPSGPPQEKLSPRDHQQMEELTGGASRGGKSGVQGRTPPRPSERPAPSSSPSSTATRSAQASHRPPPTSTTVSASAPTRTAPVQKPK
jgi:hypothetical protein